MEKDTKTLDAFQKIKTEDDEIDLKEIILNLLNNPKEMVLQSLTNEQVKNMAILTTILNMEKSKFRDELMKIRVLMDENPMKAKQLTTNLIKELK